MIDFWIFPLSTIWGAYHKQGISRVAVTKIAATCTATSEDRTATHR